MKKIFLIICILVSVLHSNGQNKVIVQGTDDPPPPPPPVEINDSNHVYQYVEEQPEFPGGMLAMRMFLQKNIVYPQLEKESGIQGKVFIEFIVDKDGSVTDVEVRKGVPGGPGLEKEAVRVVKLMPNWKPGKMSGKPVRVKYMLPVSFRLDGGIPVPGNINARFPGGKQAMDDYFRKNLVYPAKAKKKKKEGVVSLTALIGSNGKILDVIVTEGIGMGCDEEAVRLVKAMPGWEPAKQDGKLIESKEMIRVEFKL